MSFAIGYAILRYHIAGDVPWKDLPFLILNKGLSLGAFILISFNFALGPAKNLSFQTFLREDKAFIGFITSRRFLIWALMLGGIHVLFMGYSGWMEPAGWNGGLPPISLVAFIFFVIGYLLNLFGRE